VGDEADQRGGRQPGQHGSERPFQVVDDRAVAARPGDGDHVEPHLAWRGGVRGQVGGRQAAQSGLLGGGDGGRRAAVAAAAPGLDLAEDQQPGAGGDQVDLTLPAAPVAGDDPQARRLEQGGGERSPRRPSSSRSSVEGRVAAMAGL